MHVLYPYPHPKSNILIFLFGNNALIFFIICKVLSKYKLLCVCVIFVLFLINKVWTSFIDSGIFILNKPPQFHQQSYPNHIFSLSLSNIQNVFCQ